MIFSSVSGLRGRGLHPGSPSIVLSAALGLSYIWTNAASVRLPSGRAARMSRRSGVLGREPEVGERALAVEVLDDPDHLAVAKVEKTSSCRADSAKIEPACLSAAAVADQNKHSLVVEVFVLLGLRAHTLPYVDPRARAF